VAAGLQALTPGVLGVDPFMVSRWERGVRRPSPRYVGLLCRLFGLGADELGLVDRIDSSEPTVSDSLTTVDRAEFLGLASLLVGELASHPLTGEAWEGLADATAVEAAGEVIPRYRRLDGAVPSTALLGSVQAHLLLTLRLRHSARTPWAQRRLSAAASEAASFAAWLRLDVNDLATAEKLYRVAIDIASQSDVALLAGYQLGSLASLVIESGNASQALALLRAAERQLPSRIPSTATVWLWSLRATAHAAAREPVPTHRALEAAGRAIAARQDEPAWPWLTPFGSDKLAAVRGVCEARLGRPVAAVQSLDEALASPGLTIRRRGELLVDLATAHARRREPQPTCAALGQALTIATARRSQFLMARIRAARGQLDRTWNGIREVAEFDERLHTTWL
jgi:tetratricopeptide (TPR) repeat protein